MPDTNIDIVIEDNFPCATDQVLTAEGYCLDLEDEDTADTGDMDDTGDTDDTADTGDTNDTGWADQCHFYLRDNAWNLVELPTRPYLALSDESPRGSLARGWTDLFYMSVFADECGDIWMTSFVINLNLTDTADSGWGSRLIDEGRVAVQMSTWNGMVTGNIYGYTIYDENVAGDQRIVMWVSVPTVNVQAGGGNSFIVTVDTTDGAVGDWIQVSAWYFVQWYGTGPTSLYPSGGTFLDNDLWSGLWGSAIVLE